MRFATADFPGRNSACNPDAASAAPLATLQLPYPPRVLEEGLVPRLRFP